MNSLLSSREIHLVNVENFLGGPVFTREDVTVFRRRYQRLTAMPSYAQVIVATSAFTPAVAAGVGWVGCRLLVRRGHNGADLSLLVVAESEDLAARFERIAIGSGDGIFTDVATRLAARGTQVCVVSRRASLSRSLELAVADVRFIDGRENAAACAARIAA